MTDEPEQEPESQEPRRRVLAAGTKEKTEGRSGCIITGAVLGVIIGLTFAFYGLPPILRSIYGEDVVKLGETWEEDGRVVQVVELLILESDPRQFSVRLSISTEEGWGTTADDWTLVTDAGDVLELASPGDDELSFAGGESRDVVMGFNELPETEGEPDYLRLGDPKTRFELTADE